MAAAARRRAGRERGLTAAPGGGRSFDWDLGSQVPDEPTPSSALVGRQLGPYLLEAPLAKGGFGSVYRARDTRLLRQVAIKVLDRFSERDRERFRRELLALSGLRHPNLVTVHDAGEQDGVPYLVLELVEGRPLSDWCRTRNLLPVAEVVQIMSQAARGLEHAHRQGVLHRDVKPSNILVERGEARVVDFGLAFRTEGGQGEQRLSQTGAWVGSPAYMAPEQAGSGRTPDARTDVYGLGATLYHALCGRLPLDDASGSSPVLAVHRHVPRPPSEVRPEIPPALDAICARCLEKEPADRFPSAAALADALERCDLEARPRRPRWGRRLALAAALLAVVGAGALGAWLERRGPGLVPEAQVRGWLAEARAQAPNREGDAPALALYTRAEEAVGERPALRIEVLTALAWHHFYRCRFVEALALADQLLALAPDQLAILALRADCLTNLEHRDASEAVYQQIVRLDPQGADGLHAAAELAHGQDMPRANELARRALTLAPTMFDNWIIVGYHELREGRIEAALDAFDRAAAAEPRDIRPVIGRISVLGYQDRLDEALVLAQRLIEDLGDQAPAGLIALRGKVQHGRGYNELADADLTLALERAPDDVNVLLWRGIIRNNLRQKERSLADLRRAWSIDPEEFKRVLQAACPDAMAEQILKEVQAP